MSTFREDDYVRINLVRNRLEASLKKSKVKFEGSFRYGKLGLVWLFFELSFGIVFQTLSFRTIYTVPIHFLGAF